MSFFFVKFIAMKVKYIITKRGSGKAVYLPDGVVVLNSKTTQKDLKKLHELKYTKLVEIEDAKEDITPNEDATD